MSRSELMFVFRMSFARIENAVQALAMGGRASGIEHAQPMESAQKCVLGDGCLQMPCASFESTTARGLNRLGGVAGSRPIAALRRNQERGRVLEESSEPATPVIQDMDWYLTQRLQRRRVPVPRTPLDSEYAECNVKPRIGCNGDREYLACVERFNQFLQGLVLLL